MSELINNREKRKETLKEIIKQLHQGKSVEEVKGKFEEVFEGVSAAEISEAETELMQEGIPVSEIQGLCDVHASVFKGSIDEIHSPEKLIDIPGHPANILVQENKEINRILQKEIEPNKAADTPEKQKLLAAGMENLLKIDIHYQKKENLFFPYMEKYGVTAPPKVMWGVDDEIRDLIKEVKRMLEQSMIEQQQITQKTGKILEKAKEMIFKEENILLPMLEEKLTAYEWKSIADESQEFGYLIEQVPEWTPAKSEIKQSVLEEHCGTENGKIQLPSGIFTIEQLTAMLNTLPFDITFVDKNDEVAYFSEGKERAFARTRSIVGRNVSNCHPPASVHVVEQIVADFKSGKKDHEDFWIQMGSKFILIRYFAVHDTQGKYLGVLEVTQDIAPIQQITGEKRLVD